MASRSIRARFKSRGDETAQIGARQRAVTAADIINARRSTPHAKYFLRTAVEPATDEIENAYDDEST